MGTDFSRQSGKSDWGGRRGAAVPSGVFSGRIMKVAWQNAICCVWKLQIHYILIFTAFWYILNGCKIVARKRYQRHGFVQFAQEKAGNPKISGFFLVEVTGFEPATFWSRTKRATKLRYTSEKDGANEGTRTPDLLITNQLLYRLSYIGTSATLIISKCSSFVQHFFVKIVYSANHACIPAPNAVR